MGPGLRRAHRSATIRGGAVRYADRLVLRDLELNVGPRDRLAVIGDNGAGKSTILGMLAGTVPLAAGERAVELPGGLAWAQQRPAFAPGSTVEQALGSLLAGIRGIEARMTAVAARMGQGSPAEQAALAAQLGDLEAEYGSRGGYTLDIRLNIALEQLGLGGLDRDTAVDGLSGGERARLALAAAVSAEAELLLLDEPTNDLDEAGLGWLEDRLGSHRGALVVVSHDRAFLDRFAEDILALEDGAVRRYGNGYSGYLAGRAAERRSLANAREAWRRDIARTEAMLEANAFRLSAIPRKMEMAAFGHGAFRQRSRDHGAMSRIRTAKERLSRLLESPAPKPPEPLRFAPPFTAPPRAGAGAPNSTDDGVPQQLLTASGVRLGAAGTGPRLLLEQLELRAGDRWLVSGPNGSGKTTLLRVLAGELPPVGGTLAVRPGLRVAWLRQDLSDPSGRRLLPAFAAATGTDPEEAAAMLLGLGLFPPSALSLPLNELSVGQLRRLELAVALTAPSDLLLLDEPTNHLSPELAEQLEDALEGYPGAVVTVTHDRRWRGRMASGHARQLQLGPGGVVTQG